MQSSGQIQRVTPRGMATEIVTTTTTMMMMMVTIVVIFGLISHEFLAITPLCPYKQCIFHCTKIHPICCPHSHDNKLASRQRDSGASIKLHVLFKAWQSPSSGSLRLGEQFDGHGSLNHLALYEWLHQLTTWLTHCDSSRDKLFRWASIEKS